VGEEGLGGGKGGLGGEKLKGGLGGGKGGLGGEKLEGGGGGEI
jgi:hypothetical protein